MGLPKEIAALIERFDRNREIYASGQYHEMQLRQEFINPLFAIYDTPIKPEKTDKASNARIRYFTYKDYAEKCDELKRLYKKRKEAGGMK